MSHKLFPTRLEQRGGQLLGSSTGPCLLSKVIKQPMVYSNILHIHIFHLTEVGVLMGSP